MRVAFAIPDAPPHAITRVEDALIRYAPTHTDFVRDPRAADLVIVHVIGRRDRVADDTERYRRRGQHYALLQYVLRSTQKPSTADWIAIWRDAAVTLSYYDLPALCAEDGVSAAFPFYHTPLGADGTVFYPRPVATKPFVVATSGHSWLTESVRECAVAAEAVQRPVFHLGRELHRIPVVCRTGIDDETLATYYSGCDFVSGLRRTEGFELPAVEGLFCGARPLLFDRPHYRHWYDGVSTFIAEQTRADVVASLTAVFERGADPVTDAERAQARERFDWQRIAAGFWERVS